MGDKNHIRINDGYLKTPWTGQVDAESPLPEYPRPQFVRFKWLNLNGLWKYEIIPIDSEMTKSYLFLGILNSNISAQRILESSPNAFLAILIAVTLESIPSV